MCYGMLGKSNQKSIYNSVSTGLDQRWSAHGTLALKDYLNSSFHPQRDTSALWQNGPITG